MKQMPRVLPAVFLPVLVPASLISGMLTATVAGAIAVAHTIWMGFCAMREVQGRGVPGGLLYAGLYIVAPFALPLAIVVGLVNYPEVSAWLPRLFGC
jgi:hypothetical protein